MGRALLVIGWLATLGIAVAGLLGYIVGEAFPSMTPHILVGFVASLLLLFSHCWILFYLIGTGKAIREAVEEYGLEQALIEQTKSFKNESYPWLMGAMSLVIATFVMGGGAYTGATAGWVHHLLFYLALATQVWTLAIEGRVLMANERLMAGIDSRVAASAAPALPVSPA